MQPRTLSPDVSRIVMFNRMKTPAVLCLAAAMAGSLACLPSVVEGRARLNADQAGVPAASPCVFPTRNIVVRDFVFSGEGKLTRGDEIGNPFVATYIADIQNALASMASGDCPAIASLTVVRLPLVVSSDEAVTKYLKTRVPVGDARGIWSPWADVVFGPSGAELTVYLSDRQFVADAAAGSAGVTGDEPRAPIDIEPFRRYCKLWQPLVMYGYTDAERAQIKSDIRREMPADLYWLFEQSPQSERGGYMDRNIDTEIRRLRSQNYQSYVGHSVAVIRDAFAHPDEHVVIRTAADIG